MRIPLLKMNFAVKNIECSSVNAFTCNQLFTIRRFGLSIPVEQGGAKLFPGDGGGASTSTVEPLVGAPMFTPFEDGTLHAANVGTTMRAFGVDAMVYGEPVSETMLMLSRRKSEATRLD